MSKNKGLNRIKVVLAEKQCTNKWLAEQLDKGEATISKWCTNRAQPSLETIVEIANVLQVDVKDLLQSTAQESDVVYIKIPKSTLQWLAKMKQTGKLGIALNMNGATLQLVEGFTAAKYLIIHNKSNKYAALYVDGKGPRLVSANEMADMVTTKRGASVYLVYNADLNAVPAFGELDFTPITKSGDSYSPHLLSIKSLIKNHDV